MSPAHEGELESRGDVRAAVRSILDSAVEAEDPTEFTTAALARLREDFAEVDDLLIHLHRALDDLQDGLYRTETRRRIETDEGRRRALRLRLIRERLLDLPAAGEGSAAQPADPRWRREPPYRGLWPFQHDQSEIFHGRSRLTAELTGQLASCLPESGMLVVTGASGAGKSSLVRAGLIPAIARGQLPVPGSRDWPVLTISPGASPLEELARRLAEVSGTDAGSIRNTLAARPGQAYLYARQALFAHTDGMEPERRDRVRDSGRLILFVDQFEELFTQAREDSDRRAFVTALLAIASGGGAPAGAVVIGVRGDFIDRCAAIPALVPVLRRHSFVVGPPEPEELRQAVTGPAAAAGLRLDDGLADDILADLRAAAGSAAYTAGTLPLLSQTMLSLWQRRDGDRLTREAYAQLGGVGRAIETGAERVYRQLDSHQKDMTAELFRRLTLVDRHGEIRRARARRSSLLAELPGLTPVLEAFTAARLLVMVGDTVEIAHDVLLRSWARLEVWLRAERARRALLDEVAADAAQWLEHGKDASFLYQGAKYESAERARAAPTAHPGPHRERDAPVEEFLDASRRSVARRAANRRAVTVALVALLAVSLVAAGVAMNRNRIAEAANDELSAQRDRLLAEDLAEASAEYAGVDGDLSRLLAAAAWRIDPSPANHAAMVRAIDDPVDYAVEPHVGAVSRVAFDPSGRHLASTDGDGEIVVWDVAAGAEVARTDRYGADDLVFSPDGRRLAVATGEGVSLLDPADLTERGALDQGPTGPTGLGYGPAGILVAVDSSLVAVDPDSGTESRAGSWDLGTIDTVAFSEARGAYLIGGSEGVWATTGSDGEPEPVWSGSKHHRLSEGGRYLVEWDDREVNLIDLELGLPIRTSRLSEPITDAAIDSEGRAVALAVGSGVRFIRTDEMTRVASAATGYAGALDFDISADGGTIALTGPSGTRVWDFAGGTPAAEPLFDAPDLPGRLVRLHPGGGSVLIVDGGGHRLVDLATGSELPVPWDPADWIAHVGFSPDGRWIHVVDGENRSEGGTVELDLDAHAVFFDAETGEARFTVEPVNGESAMFGDATIAYSPDGATVATIDDQSARVWSLDDGALLDEVVADFSATSTLAYSGDGRSLVAVGDDTPMVWDLDTGQVRPMDLPAVDGLPVFDLGGAATFTGGDRHVVEVSPGNGGIEVWDAATGAHLTSASMAGQRLLLRHVPAREAVIGLDEAGTLFSHDLGDLHTPYETLCAKTDRGLTEAEWARFLPGLDYGSIDVCD